MKFNFFLRGERWGRNTLYNLSFPTDHLTDVLTSDAPEFSSFQHVKGVVRGGGGLEGG